MTVKVTLDRLDKVLASIRDLERNRVLVGIPDSKAERKPDGEHEGPINNAALGYIHEFGSPAANIPARPFLNPGIKDAQPEIVKQLRAGAAAALDGKPAGVDKAMNAAGMAGRNGAVEKITDGPFEPLKPATIRARWNRQKNRQGKPIPDSFADSQKPLISTGQLRAAITYVIRPKRGR